jgi:FkbM family methyltransferase
MILNLDTLVKKFDLKINGIIHIGAHHGQEYELYKSHNVSNLIFFEPLISNFNVLKNNVGSECILHNIALGNKTELVDMFVETDNFGMSSSVLKPILHVTQYPSIVFNKRETVLMKRLDDIWFNRSNFNMINIDVQGYELEVFKGSVDVLQYIDYIISELNTEELYEGCAKLYELIDFLGPLGFKLVETDMAGGNWGDGLFIKK